MNKLILFIALILVVLVFLFEYFLLTTAPAKCDLLNFKSIEEIPENCIKHLK
jgi:hypothetical protein